MGKKRAQDGGGDRSSAPAAARSIDASQPILPSQTAPTDIASEQVVNAALAAAEQVGWEGTAGKKKKKKNKKHAQTADDAAGDGSRGSGTPATTSNESAEAIAVDPAPADDPAQGPSGKKKKKRHYAEADGAEPVQPVPSTENGETRSASQAEPSKKKHKKNRDAVPIHPSLRSPEPAASPSRTEVPPQPVNLAEILTMALNDDDNLPPPPSDRPVSSTGNSRFDLTQVSQDELLAALRQLNPDLVITDPHASKAPRESTSAAPAASEPALPEFTDAPRPRPAAQSQPQHKTLRAPVRFRDDLQQTIDPALVTAANEARGPGAKTSLNQTLLQSLAGMTFADVLATKWLNTTQLNELSDAFGLDFKKGQFSATEKSTLDKAIEAYSTTNNLDLDALREVIFAKGKSERKSNSDFFPTITSSLQGRPLIAVYNYVRRAFDPLAKKGSWQQHEDDALADAVATHGPKWGLVSDAVGRTKADCRDRWRNHVSVRHTKQTGAWSKEEEDALREAVKSVTTDQGRSADQDIFWSAVSQKLDGRRSRAQCRIKWLDCMNPKEKNNGEAVIWRHRDNLILAQRLLELGVTDDTGFDWKQLEDDTWGKLWSTHTLQIRWRKLKTASLKDPSMQDKELPQLLEAIVDKFGAKSDAQLDVPTKTQSKPSAAGGAEP